MKKKKRKLLGLLFCLPLCMQSVGLSAEDNEVTVTGICDLGGTGEEESFVPEIEEGETDPAQYAPEIEGYVFTGTVLYEETPVRGIQREANMISLIREDGDLISLSEDTALSFVYVPAEGEIPEETAVPDAEQEETPLEEGPEETRGGRSVSDLEYLEADEIYVDSLTIRQMKDGVGPFDTQEGDGRDTSENNRIVRTFDSLTYTLAYRTKSYGVYDSVKYGYMYYEMILPLSRKEAVFNMEAMPWAGEKTEDLSALENGTSGYTLREEEWQSGPVQILTVRRFMGPNDTAENAFPGSGTVSAAVNVLGASKGTVVQPVFSAWMDHNDVQGDVCPVHGRNEKASVTSDAVTVTCELRMNAALAKHTHTQGSDYFDFASGNEKALNKDKGTVKGRVYGFALTLQLYSRGTSSPGADIKGCAIPDGPLEVSVDLDAYYRRSSGGDIIHINDDGFIPLIWSYEGNKRPYSDAQTDGRNVKPYGLTYVTTAPLNRKNEPGQTMPSTGSNGCWNGGDWNAVQDGNRVTFTIWPKSDEHPEGYEVNPSWFPSGNSGAAASNANNQIYWRPADGVFSARIGCISAGEVYFIVPSAVDGTDIAAFYEDTGTVEVSVRDIDLKASSSDGLQLPEAVSGNDNQGNTSDDRLSWTTFISGAGVYTPNIHYASPDGYGDINHNEEPGSFLYTGEDAVAAGQPFGITWGLWCDPKGDSDNMIYAADSLMKFDDRGIELKDEDGNDAVPQIYSRGYMAEGVYTWLYAAKPDGSGWQSDEEMNAASADDLVYYASPEALESSGHVCVGILTQFRKDLQEKEYTNKGALSYIPCRSKDISVTAGNVYQTRISTTYWLKDEVTAAGGSIPLHPEGDSGDFVLPAARKMNIREDYVKAVWEEGAYTGGHTGDNHDGDSVYVTPFRSEIEIRTAQTSGNGDPARIYSYDSGQRFVEYRITPSLVTYTDTGSGDPVRVTIQASLPAGLSFSEPYGSWQADMGGYTTAGIGRKGSVTGTRLEPEVIRNGDGTTDIIWTLEDVYPGSDMKHIYFGCDIGDESGEYEVQDQQDLVLTAQISADGDNRPKTPENENISQSGIRISKQLAMAVSKKAEKRYVDPGEDVSWTVTAGNNGAADLDDLVVLDILPGNEEDGLHRFTGNLILREFRLLSKAADGIRPTADNMQDWEVWYCENETGSLQAAPAASSIRGAAGWTRALTNILSNGDIELAGDLSGRHVTAVAVIGKLKAQQTCRFSITISAPHIKGGENLKNTVFRGEDTGTSTVYVSKRSVEGIVFDDHDLDGQREDGDEGISGLTLELLRMNGSGSYEPYTDVSGDPVTVRSGADEPGRYRFGDLPEGTYAVRLRDASLSGWLPSPVHAGDPETDSDGEPVYEGEVLEEILVSGIVLPSADEIGTKEYVSDHNDIGLGEKEKPLLIRKVWSGRTADLPGQIRVTLYAGDSEQGNYALGSSDAVSGTASWQIRTEDLPVYDENGNRIIYSVRETEIAGAVKDTAGEADRFLVYGNGEEEAGIWTASYQTDGEVMTITNSWESAGTELTGEFNLTVEKCGMDGSRISGKPAEFELDEQDEDSNWVLREKKQTENGTVSFEGLPEGDYLLKETAAPEGYLRNEDGLRITVASDGTAYVHDEVRGNGITRIFRRLLKLVLPGQANWEWDEEESVLKVKNEQVRGRISIHKEVEDTEENTLLTDALYRFGLVPQGETAPKEILNVRAGETAVSSLLPYGTYTVRELLPAEDPLCPVYVYENTVLSASSAQIRENNVTVPVEAVNVYRRNTETLSVEKRWAGTPLESAVFELYSDQSNKVISRLTLSAEQNWKGSFPDLPKYTDDGEEITYDIREVPVSGYAVTKHKEGGLEVFTNHKISLTVRKKDENGGTLEGAVLVLEDKKGNAVHQWTSSVMPEDLSGFLGADSSWQVREVSAPDGYAVSEKAYIFFVDENGAVSGEDVENGVLTVSDSKIRLVIRKLDTDTGKAVSGAELVLENSEGETVETWTTNGEAKRFEGIRKGTYTLRERTAPNGYKKAAAITFTVNDCGEEQEVIMYDKKQEYGPELPDTGDHSNTLFWMTLGGISLLCAAGAGLVVKRLS